MTAIAVKNTLANFATPAKAKNSAWFFKTGPGQYGEGDQFIGVTVPEQRRVAKQFRDLPLGELSILMKSAIHEHRMTALFILVDQFARAQQRDDQTSQERIVGFYLEHRSRVNNWDLVDASAPAILGEWLRRLEHKPMLYDLARSPDLWEKRVAMIATYTLIKAGEFKDALKVAEILVHDPHDLIQKAVGWMLREVGNRDQTVEAEFLEQYAITMPRTMLRYAIEKFPEDKRQYYLKLVRDT